MAITRYQGDTTPPGEEPGRANQPADPEGVVRRAFAQHPEQGFAQLFDLYYGPLCSHAVRYVYDYALAEDLVSDVFATFWQNQGHAHIRSSYRAYLFAAVRHRAIDHLRRQVAERQPPPPPDQTPDPLRQMVLEEVRLKIDQGIRQLSAPVQRVFLLSRFEGKANAAIAQELGLSVKTVEAHITRALATIRAALADAGLLSLVAFMLLAIRFLNR